MSKRSKKYTVKRRFDYMVDEVLFRFMPGEEWQETRTHPGIPAERKIHRNVLQMLQEKNIF